MERNRLTANRRLVNDNWAQSKADLTTATVLRDAGIYYASVFFSQQTAEKALKAALFERGVVKTRGHDLIAFANALSAPLEVMNAVAELNLDFLTSRSPEYADGVPAQLYDNAEADRHLMASTTVFNWVRSIL